MRDSKQLFTTNAVTREGIAEELNLTLECCELEERIAPDDDRLTDEICQQYADAIGGIDELDVEENVTEAEASICERILKAMGIDVDTLLEEELE